MLKRKIDEILMKWKNDANKVCLTIKGARQVGKTTSILAFANGNYKSVIYMNFDLNPQLKDIFAGSLEIDKLVENISLFLPNSKLIAHNTLLFLDEIQACPNARTSLKSFALDKRFDVITSGSLLGINYKEVRSYPVGFEKSIEMYALDFEEFLWALGYERHTISLLRNYFTTRTIVPKAIHEKMIENFRNYIVIGGMPRVVDSFINNHDFTAVLSTQKMIVDSYMDDMAKYTVGEQRNRVRECFLSIPKQLAKENKKFQYNKISNTGSSRKYESSLMWLYDAGIINFAYNLCLPELPLEGNAIHNQFKVYMKDTGLFMAMLEEGSQKDIIQGNMRIYKGAIYENVIADILGKMNRKLYYFRKDSGLEVDFFIRYVGKCLPLEIKSSSNGNAKSLKYLLQDQEHFHISQGVKLGEQNIGYMGNTLTLPIYMIIFLDEY